VTTPDKQGFAHFMLKEIFEQPKALEDAISPRVSQSSLTAIAEESRITVERARELQRINIIASGSSRHAGMVGQYMLRELVHVPVDVDYASEFDYSTPVLERGELTIAITQSGETADTTAAQREAKRRGSQTLAICNVPNATIAREADGALYTHAGVETSIASTKSFTTQIAVLFMLAAYLAEARQEQDEAALRRWIHELQALPSKVKTALQCSSQCEQLAAEYKSADDLLFLGRAVHYPIAMDGALKLKEVSYIHAEGYPAGETKHGPNALLDEHMPVVVIATCDRNDDGSKLRYEKTIANIRGIKGQSARVIAVATEGDREVAGIADHTIYVPQAPELLSSILEIVPLQLFAYYVAVARGLDVDRPRNLVKSVMRE
jgi:glutamine---fructose-6-phosphate transaminase (isomerizing)